MNRNSLTIILILFAFLSSSANLSAARPDPQTNPREESARPAPNSEDREVDEDARPDPDDEPREIDEDARPDPQPSIRDEDARPDPDSNDRDPIQDDQIIELSEENQSFRIIRARGQRFDRRLKRRGKTRAGFDLIILRPQARIRVSIDDPSLARIITRRFRGNKRLERRTVILDGRRERPGRRRRRVRRNKRVRIRLASASRFIRRFGVDELILGNRVNVPITIEDLRSGQKEVLNFEVFISR